ncbi:23S rRNA (adenine(2030)-N(6))-methyltransferase RlmJ [Inhella sp.]|uniref:23S rRNA (adenine(2030)-N(6))-methyltransferase RlmJ n=1 Tax=Inhella sp. TaxID=1921806 RepID=UPI0035ADAA41
MLAYRHAFHAGNHADVLKHLVLIQLLQHLNQKEKGYRVIDTHAGAGAYRVGGSAQQQEWADGVGRIWGATDAPAGVAAYLESVKAVNGAGKIKLLPGSPLIAQHHLRAQDELHAFELHPTDLRQLEKLLTGLKGIHIHLGDGYQGLLPLLPPPTRRGLILIDPPYELKADYARVLAAVRGVLQKFPDAVLAVWVPQLQRLEAQQLPQRLVNAIKGVAKKGWLDASLTVLPGQDRGFGLLGSHMVVANPPHTLGPMLAAELPWLAERLGQFPGAKGVLRAGA